MENLDNLFHKQVHHRKHGDILMNGLTGMEKFSHLEDKIYLTIEFAKKMREENEKIEKENSELRRNALMLENEKARLEERVESLLSERDAIQLKVEAMLDAMTVLDSEVAEAVGRVQ
jgi:predicted nuclease with TOPRIM domain